MASPEHTPEERQRAIDYVRRALSVGRDTEPDPDVVAATAEKVLKAHEKVMKAIRPRSQPA